MDALMRRALETGETVALACAEGSPPPGVTRVALPRAPRRRPARDRALAVEGEKALRDAGCDVVLAFRHALSCDVYLPHGGLVAEALAAHDACRGGTGLLRRLGAALSAKRRFFLEAERALLAGATGPRVIALSKGLAGRMGATYPASRARTVVVPNGVDVVRFDPEPFADRRPGVRRELGIPPQAYVGLLLAHEPWLKGLGTLLPAMARPEVAGLTPPFHLVVAGRKGGGDVSRAARRLGVADRVHVAGPVEDPRPIYAASDVLVQPSWHDPCSLVCLEALAMGVPVITTSRNGVTELMAMRGGIPLERPDSVEGVAVAIRVLADPALRAVTADDARYVAAKNRLGTRLDQVLDVCRGPAAVRPVPPRESEDMGPAADPCLETPS